MEGNSSVAGLNSSFNESGRVLQKGFIWHGIATSTVLDSYEAGRPRFSITVKEKVRQPLRFIGFLKNDTATAIS
jgi:hypothetical protein